VIKFKEKHGNRTAKKNLVQLQLRKQYVIGECKNKCYSSWRKRNTYFSSAGYKMAWPRTDVKTWITTTEKTGFLCLQKEEFMKTENNVSTWHQWLFWN